MSEKLFFEAMGELSDKYISEAIDYQSKKNVRFKGFMRYVAAACIMFVVGFGMLMAVSTEARAAVPLSCLARPTAVPTANSIGKFPNTISPIPCIIFNITVIIGILTNDING